MDSYIALLRGINVGGHRKVPMAELREMATKLGHTNVRTHLASGNLLFDAEGELHALESALEAAMVDTFGFEVDTILLTAATWAGYLEQNPFLAQSQDTPNFVMVCVGKQPAGDVQLQRLQSRAAEDEEVHVIDGVIWCYYANGAGRSKMMLKATEGVWTTRNWRTAQKLADMTAVS